ncbi:MAG: hypothetical protein ACFFCD_11775 [Promethearchaeota archaeon]
MGRKNEIIHVVTICAIVICLLATTATITVANGDWGNLQSGDRIEWKTYLEPVEDPSYVLYDEVEIISINGKDLTYNYNYTTVSDVDVAFTLNGTRTDDDHILYVYSQSYLQQMETDADADPNKSWTTANYDWNGINYKTYHFKENANDIPYESWIDQNTGIIFEIRFTLEGATYKITELLSTTAILTKAGIFGGICLGTVLISLVSATTLISYSIIHNQKKKRT